MVEITAGAHLSIGQPYWWCGCVSTQHTPRRVELKHIYPDHVLMVHEPDGTTHEVRPSRLFVTADEAFAKHAELLKRERHRLDCWEGEINRVARHICVAERVGGEAVPQ